MKYNDLLKEIDKIYEDGFLLGQLSIAEELKSESEFMENKDAELLEDMFNLAYDVYLEYDAINAHDAVTSVIDYYYKKGTLKGANYRDVQEFIPTL